MAGSWQHMTTKSGKFLNNERFCGMIENLGDAYEAAEECFGMVHWLAEQLANVTGQPREDLIRAAEEHYRDGLNLGGVQKS
jgi:hypothetical protein